MEMRSLNSDKAPAAVGNYSQAVEVTDARRMVFVSGQIPVDVDGNVPEGFDAQCRLTFENIRLQLAEADMTFDNIAKLTVVLSHYEYRDDLRRIRKEVLGEHRPALTVVIAQIFDPVWLLEAEAVAVD